MSADISELKKIVEGAILASDKPITYEKILGLFEENARPERAELVEAFKSLQEDYQDRGIELKQVASGLRFQVSEKVTPWVSRLQEDKPARYSRALLETIAIIAYRQPVTRGGIEDIRGVAVSSQIIRTLMERDWVRVVGHMDVPGKPALYATTKQFLDYFNLKNLNELPPLSEIKDLEQLNRELNLEDDTREKLEEMIEQEKLEAEAQLETGQGVSEEGEPLSEEENLTEQQLEHELLEDLEDAFEAEAEEDYPEDADKS